MTAPIVSEGNYEFQITAHDPLSVMFDADRGMRFLSLRNIKRPLFWQRVAEGKRRD